jgi:hypothetical protein
MYMLKSGWHLEKCWAYKNNVTVESRFYLRVNGMSLLSILGDTADFGEDKKKERFPLLPLLKPSRNEPGGCFSTSNNNL